MKREGQRVVVEVLLYWRAPMQSALQLELQLCQVKSGVNWPRLLLYITSDSPLAERAGTVAISGGSRGEGSCWWWWGDSGSSSKWAVMGNNCVTPACGIAIWLCRILYCCTAFRFERARCMVRPFVSLYIFKAHYWVCLSRYYQVLRNECRLHCLKLWLGRPARSLSRWNVCQLLIQNWFQSETAGSKTELRNFVFWLWFVFKRNVHCVTSLKDFQI